MKVTYLRDIPEVKSVEARCGIIDKLMRDEREQLEKDLVDLSIRLFGTTQSQTYYDTALEVGYFGTEEDWETHFEFLDFIYEEGEKFWSAFGLNINSESGEELWCMPWLERQLVCAVRQLNPRASLRFIEDSEKSLEQLKFEAEAWGKTLLNKHQT